MLCCALLSGCYSTCASLPVSTTGRLSTTAFMYVCLCEKARLCECRTPLGLMYLCHIHSCGMREANYRGDCEHVAFFIPLSNIVWILFAALNSVLYVRLCLYIPQCCVKYSSLLLFNGTDVCMLTDIPYHLSQSPELCACRIGAKRADRVQLFHTCLSVTCMDEITYKLVYVVILHPHFLCLLLESLRVVNPPRCFNWRLKILHQLSFS